MDLKLVEEFIKIAKKAGVSELSYGTEHQNLSVKFPFGDAQPVLRTKNIVGAQVATTAAVGESANKEPAKNLNLLEVKSPFVGTFYRAPSPGAANYANVGDKVSKGKVLCIIEAMKIMNEIESEVAGEIAEICVENESYVEYGQVLFRLKA